MKVDQQSREEAEKIQRSLLSDRFLELDRFEQYVEGTQYEGRPDFFTLVEDVPLLERAPKIVYPIAQMGIRSNLDMIFGEDKFPAVSAYVEDEASGLDIEKKISPDERDALTKFIDAVVSQTGLKGVSRELLYNGQSCGTAVAICSVRGGKLRVDTTHAKWCDAEFGGPDGREVIKLTIQYPYVEQFWNPKLRANSFRCMVYRRVIDQLTDTTFKPVQVDTPDANVEDLTFSPDPSKTFLHALAFCPVVWYKHLPRVSTLDNHDGHAIHEHVLDEIDCLNFSLSQRQRATNYLGEPQMWETGVDPQENPSALGRRAVPVLSDEGGGSYYDPAEMVRGAKNMARRKGPGTVWRYQNPEARVGMMSMPGDAVKAIDDNCRDLKNKICEAMAVVNVDPDFLQAGSEISGRALGWLHRRQTSRCDQIRADFGENCVIPIVNALLHICAKLGPEGGVYVPGIVDIMPTIKKFLQAVDEAGDTWMEPRLVLDWEPYFAPTEVDQRAIIQGTLALLRSGVITRKTAVERISPFYPIGNIDEYMEALKDDAGLSQMMAAPPDAQSLNPVAGASHKARTEEQAEQAGVKLNRVPKKKSVLSGIIEETARELPEV